MSALIVWDGGADCDWVVKGNVLKVEGKGCADYDELNGDLEVIDGGCVLLFSRELPLVG